MEVDDFETKTNVFLSWLSSMGVVMNPKMAVTDLRSESRGRGVMAVADFEEDEVIFSIPRSAVLNIKTALNTSNAALSQHDILNMPSWLALTTILLNEGRPDSQWAPYLSILPHQLDNLIFWSDAELAELQASKVVNRIGKSRAEEKFYKSVVPLGLANTEECHRVASIIMSYAFDIPETNAKEIDQSQDEAEGAEEDLVSDDEDDEKTVLSMIPLADMLNADADRNNARLCCDNEDLEMRSIKPIGRGEEIFNDYGQLPRCDLLRRYGYITENYTPYDIAELSTKELLLLLRSSEALPGLNQAIIPLSQEELESRVELAEREGIYDDSYDVCHPGPEGPSIPDELIALLYLMLLNDESLEALLNSDGLPSRSKLTTELVGQVLVAALQLRENEYATTLEEDEALLLTGNLSHRIAMAVQVRHGEKAVLRAAIEEAKSFTGSNKRMRTEEKNIAAGETAKGKRSFEEAGRSKKRGRFR